MLIRKSTSLLVSFLVLFSNLGLAFNVHYCHNEVSSIFVDYQFRETCVEQQISCCTATKSHSDCCSNKIVKVEKKSDKTLVTSFQIQLDCPVLIKSNTLSFLQTEMLLENKLSYFYCDSNAPPFYKLYCQLVFYA